MRTLNETPRPTDDRPAVDPRFEARRAAVERDQRRRRLSQWLTVTGVVAFGLFLYALSRSPLLDVDRVQVVGAERSTAEAVLGAAAVQPGEQMLDLDPAQVERRVEKLPWVRSARVARSWPSTLRISVVERRAVARIAAPDGGWFLADAEGRLVALDTDLPADLVEVDGVVEGGAPGVDLTDRARAGLSLIPHFSPAIRARVQRLRFEDEAGLELILDPDPESAQAAASVNASGSGLGDDGDPDELGESPIPIDPDGAIAPLVRVRFGAVEQVERKLAALDALLREVDPSCSAVIDVRVPDLPTTNRPPDCLAALGDEADHG